MDMLTQDPRGTQFQALWAGMTQWTGVGIGARVSAQTTRSFSAAEPWKAVAGIMRVMEYTKAHTKVFALDPRSPTLYEHGDAYTGDGETHTRIDLEHQADMESLVSGMNALSPEPSPVQLSKDDLSWRYLLDRSTRSTRSTSFANFATARPGNMAPPYQSRGARVMFALKDKRKCHLMGNIWVDPLPPRRQQNSIRTLVLLERSSGSPLEWRRLFNCVLDKPTIAHAVVPM